MQALILWRLCQEVVTCVMEMSANWTSKLLSLQLAKWDGAKNLHYLGVLETPFMWQRIMTTLRCWETQRLKCVSTSTRNFTIILMNITLNSPEANRSLSLIHFMVRVTMNHTNCNLSKRLLTATCIITIIIIKYIQCGSHISRPESTLLRLCLIVTPCRRNRRVTGN